MYFGRKIALDEFPLDVSFWRSGVMKFYHRFRDFVVCELLIRRFAYFVLDSFLQVD
jgi:hypothetical protein